MREPRRGRRRQQRLALALAGLAAVGTASAAGATVAGPAAAASPAARPRPAAPCPVPPASVVRRAPGRGARTVALTIDDGPSSETPAVLAALAKAKVHATFFVVGSHVAPNAAAARQAARAGHLVADHTWDHRYPQQVAGG